MDACVLCHREMGGSSKPRWVFRHTDFRLLGQAHITCATKRKLPHASIAQSPTVAQFVVWLRSRLLIDASSQDRECTLDALMLADSATSLSGDLNAEQQRSLDHWSNGLRRIGSEQQDAIVRRYRELLSAFAASDVPGVQPGEGGR